VKSYLNYDCQVHKNPSDNLSQLKIGIILCYFSIVVVASLFNYGTFEKGGAKGDFHVDVRVFV